MKNEIREYLTANRATQDKSEFADEDSLLESGVIDSMNMLELIKQSGRFIATAANIHD